VKTVIHVNQHHIRANKKDGGDRPPLTVKTYCNNTKAHEVQLTGPAKVVYHPDDPLPCGARCWVETESPVIVVR
jgi:hypothetical protein